MFEVGRKSMGHTNGREDVKKRLEEIEIPKISEGIVEYLWKYVVCFEMQMSLEHKM